MEHEYKYLLSLEETSAFLDKTGDRLAPLIYDAQFPVAFTRTIYLDTHDQRYLRSSTAPVSKRLRIRQYAGAGPGSSVASFFNDECYLDLKESAGARRSKTRMRATIDAVRALLAGESLLSGRLGDQEFLAYLLLRRELAGGSLRPQVGTWYRRKSFTVATQRLRITLDEDIVFFEPGPSSSHHAGPSNSEICGGVPGCILEVKVARHRAAMPQWLRDAIGKDPCSNFSKFQRAMRAIIAKRARKTLAKRELWLPPAPSG